MRGIIKVDTDMQTVSARELHEKLNIGTAFKDWFPRMCEYGFSENEDFNPLKIERIQKEGNREVKRAVTDYQISIDMAKQICMIQRTPEGKQVRQYLIDLEKAWNTPEAVMARALKMAQEIIKNKDAVIQEQKQVIDKQKPKALFADAVSSSKTSILIGDLAKLICQNGVQIGQKRLFDWMRENGYLMKSGSSKNMPKQRYVENGIFEIKESNVVNPDGSVRTTKTTKVTGKGQIYFVQKFLGHD